MNNFKLKTGVVAKQYALDIFRKACNFNDIEGCNMCFIEDIEREYIRLGLYEDFLALPREELCAFLMKIKKIRAKEEKLEKDLEKELIKEEQRMEKEMRKIRTQKQKEKVKKETQIESQIELDDDLYCHIM